MKTLELDTTNKTQKQPISTTGSLAVIDALLSEEVDIIFGYPGGAIMPIYDALFDFKDKLNHILVRHEQGAKNEQRDPNADNEVKQLTK